MLEKMVWHDGMDWVIQQDWDGYSYRSVDSYQWLPGVPPGMTILDAALLFDDILPPRAAA
ncbi:MAG TPA: hypothetical protein VJ692_04050 [Nitrospiraceae bacterium]|nr:hypothetical protein [Nitrospiraceae bacterium]